MTRNRKANKWPRSNGRINTTLRDADDAYKPSLIQVPAVFFQSRNKGTYFYNPSTFCSSNWKPSSSFLKFSLSFARRQNLDRTRFTNTIYQCVHEVSSHH